MRAVTLTPMKTTTNKGGAEKRAMAAAKAERAAVRAAAKAKAERAAYFADLFKSDYIVTYTSEAGETRTREMRDRDDAEREARYLASQGATNVVVAPAKGAA